MERIRVFPQSGKVLTDEQGNKIPESGKNVKKNSYWRRRIADKDCRFEPVKEDAASPKSSPTPKKLPSNSQNKVGE